MLPSVVARFSCNGVDVKIRLLLDSCSQPRLISDRFVQKFKLAATPSEPYFLKGVGNGPVASSACICIILFPRFTNGEIVVTADVVPASTIAYKADLTVPDNLNSALMKYPLADPIWSKKRMIMKYVDIVIGDEFYKKIILDKCVWVDELKLWSTLYGWIVAGIAPNPSLPNLNIQFSGLTIQDIDRNLQKFWEIKEIGELVSSLMSEHSPCAKHFSENLSIAPYGKFIVSCPSKSIK